MHDRPIRFVPTTTRVAFMLTVALVAGLPAPAPAQEPPSAARIAELSDQWSDLVNDPPPGTTYRLFETAARGKGTKGSYLVYLPPSYHKESARRYLTLYWLHGGFGNAREGAWTVEHLWPSSCFARFAESRPSRCAMCW